MIECRGAEADDVFVILAFGALYISTMAHRARNA